MRTLTLVDTGTVFWPRYMAEKSETEAFLHLVELGERLGPDTVFCLDDKAENLERRAILPEYKTGRPPRPPEAHQAYADAVERLRENGVALASVPRWEADDVIATLARQAPECGFSGVVVVSSDKDLLALVSDSLRVVRRKLDMGPAEVERVTGVPPALVAEWLALGGDSADHIPGCPLVGSGNAAKLLKHFGSLEALRKASVDEVQALRGIGPKSAEALREWFDVGGHELSLALTMLRDWLDLDLATILTPEF